ncbi:polysaccharide pyruvyl transferase family protein [Aliikangiella marina]|uniref:Polysaccharide pyruvyl transferase family protein n=1 Tax=Aliikangiella marina TaxID=1712262 RepID=A0A545TIH3_9GAMM|nr:polysaccharide pyruvyl transferase family protein [Aliikangiella marina]TQV77029.1 polysaccharide pyruvyl transferase family protein [Aliikangiella marina]
MKKIFILNAQPGGNKGAEAMLETVVLQIEKQFGSDCKLYLEALGGSTSYKLFAERLGLDLNFITFNPKKVIKPYHVQVTESDVVIDIGGINYHDKSIKGVLRNFIRHSFFLRKNAKLVFFTQDFGPCEKLLTRILAKYVYKRASSIFMRSEKSRNLLIDLVGDQNIKGPFPDCTLIYPPESFSEQFEKLNIEKYFIVSPSAIMYNKYGADYLSKISDVIRGVYKDYTPVVLVHNFTSNDGSSDLKVCNMLVDKVRDCAPVLFDKELPPRELKYILSKSCFTLTSRYHVVVGSLSCNVPSIAIGWSHKYQEFLKLYNLESLNLDFNDKFQKKVLKKLEEFKDNDFYSRSIGQSNVALKSKVKDSFSLLFDEIR